MQEAKDCRGLWESEGQSEQRPPLHPGRLLARSQATETMGGTENVQGQGPRLGLQPREHPEAIDDTGVLFVGAKLLGLCTVRPGPGGMPGRRPSPGMDQWPGAGSGGGDQETQL